MHKNTKSILGNPYQQGRKPSQSFAIFLKRKTSHTITKPSTQEGVAILIISDHNF
jgi:hypothetical protein